MRSSFNEPRANSTVIAFDLGGTKLRCGISKTNRVELLYEDHWRSGPQGFENDISRLKEWTTRVCSERSCRGAFAISISSGASVNEHGRVLSWPNRPEWVGHNPAREMQDAFGVPVYLLDDAYAAGIAESVSDVEKHFSNAVFLTVGTGIGASIVVDGVHLRSANRFCGEIGHWVIDPNGPQCSCGKRGCAQQYAGGHALEREADSLGISVENLISRATPQSLEGIILTQLGTRIGLLCANIVDVLNLEACVVNSRLGGSQSTWWRGVTTAFYANLSDRNKIAALRASTIGENAGLVGAGLFGLNPNEFSECL